MLTNFQRWLGAWLSLIDNVICLLTGGCYFPGLFLKYFRYVIEKKNK